MDIRKIKKLIELLEESGLAELEIQEKDESVRLSRYSQHAPPAPAPVAAAPAPAAPAAEQSGSAPADGPPDVPEGQIIRAPMVGTFYASPSPESEPFVQVGSTIAPGDAVCIIEAMKMFNTIEAEFAGKVVSVLAENGQPVEYDQALFVVR